MIATLIQVAKEMIRYEASLRKKDEETIILNRLCDSAVRGKEELKVAVLDMTDGRVRLEDYKDEERCKYLYALSTGRHAIGPAWRLDFGKRGKSRDEIIKTGLREVKGALEELIKLSESLCSEEQQWVEACRQALAKPDAKIITWIDEKVSNQSSVLFTIAYKGKLPGELKGLQHAFIHKRVLGERRAAPKGKGYCAICGKDTTVRSAIPFRFFTIEKLGFSPMGREDMVWKYAPVCEECAKWLCVAESYLQENLSTRVAGKNAFLIPDLEPNASQIRGSFIHYLWEWHERMKGRQVPHEDFPWGELKGGSLPDLFEGLVENDEWFKGNPPFRSASLVFYQPGQKFLFLYTIPEILPRNLQRASRRLKGLRDCLNRKVLGDEGVSLSKQLKSDFGFIGRAWQWPHAGEMESRGILKLTPMHLVEAILTDKRPTERIFWSDVDKLLRATYREWLRNKQQQNPLHSVLAKQVRLIWTIWALIYGRDTKIGGENMEMQQVVQQKPRELSPDFWEAFFQSRLLLDSAPKRAMFLIGALFGSVEAQQRKERETKTGEMPIISRLRGLTISRKEIEAKLFPELMLKLRQLDGNTRAVQAIQQAAADYASQGGELSDEEARFCFCLGWALSWLTLQEVRNTLGVKDEEGEKAKEAQEEETDET